MKVGRSLQGRWIQFKSIQSRITVVVSVLMILVVAIMGFNSYRSTAEAVQANSQQYIAELMKQVNRNIQSYVNNMEDISLLALTNKDVKYYISSTSYLGDAERRPYEKRISDLFQTILVTRKDIASIMIFGYNERFVSDRRITSLNPNSDIEEQLWYKRAQEEGGKSVLSPPHVQNIIQNEYRWVVSLSRELKSTDGIKGEGIFLVDLNLSVIDEICSQIRLGKRGYVYIVDHEGHIIYHPQQQLIYNGLKKELIDEVRQSESGSFITNEGERRIYTIQDTTFGWKLVGVAYMDELITNKSAIQMLYVLWGGIVLAVALVISHLISIRLSKPIQRLQANMKRLERGDFDIRVEVESVDEIGQLGRAFNMMVSKIKELMDQTIKDQELKRKNELKLLQAQINPHFLYNTLDSIIWMAYRKKNDEVVAMTSSLAKLFRSSIHRKEDLIPISVEVEHITSYLMIQKMRYRDMLDYRIDIEDEIIHYRMPKILLQPFVENAIYHGIKNKSETGIVTITGRQQNDKIVFKIHDNGQGMNPSLLKDLLQQKQNATSGKGIGIANVNERIKLLCGEDGVSITSDAARGTEVTIILPKIQ